MNQTNSPAQYLFVGVVALFVILVAYIFLPFLTPLVLAGAASVIVYPIYRYFRGEKDRNGAQEAARRRVAKLLALSPQKSKMNTHFV
jgi:predicted PurR-regulated permease PerM